MIFGKKDKQPKGITPAYMPKIMEAVADPKRVPEAIEITQQAAVDYFNRLTEAAATISGQDAAIMVKLYRHMADEIERADPQAAKIVKAMRKIPLPPIDFKISKK